MKRSDLYIKITTAVLFLAVASYIGVYIYNAVIDTFVTVSAIGYTLEETFSAQGYIVRSETVLSDMGATTLPIVNEGEKVASGQAIAVEYLSSAALETASELREIRFKIAQLEALGGGAAETAGLESVMKLSAVVNNGNLSNLDELSLMVDTYIFSGDLTPETELPVLRSQLERLESRVTGISTIYAPQSGTFSQVVDGFEHVEPELLTDLLPAGLVDLFVVPAGGRGAGKLVTSFEWHYAAVLDADDAVRLTVGQPVPVQFSGAYNATVDMVVRKVGLREDNDCVVLFSSDKGIHDVASLRHMSSEIVFGVVYGIRVPKEAIHLDNDATTFIYLQTGVRAERVDVEILREIGESYLVRDGAESGTPLRVDSTIIVKANNLYDGKIIA